jgi:hypothetical protein
MSVGQLLNLLANTDLQGSGNLIAASSEEQVRLDELVAQYAGELLDAAEAAMTASLTDEDKITVARGRLFVCRVTEAPQYCFRQEQNTSSEVPDKTRVFVGVKDTQGKCLNITLIGACDDFWGTAGEGTAVTVRLLQ